ncbi:hypothetical protein E0W68_07905 [Flavobacterium salilacus subsp. salilacus]|uniref:hypothetical protein n=1 Tax=Flavobacterium TaxID=237 RepID=UPI001074D9E8|nr:MULTISPECIES: hypothetical protein [Flavobacterium]KAF2518670.1 hypothetical protein E0W68_07905 [Flavobacterium salilacus subsp. salilacus]MBE1613633.1 hypothetical protein [Flavobacterium sp. SaA2.13]
MKKIRLFIIGFLSTTLLIVSCSKDENYVSETNNSNLKEKLQIFESQLKSENTLIFELKSNTDSIVFNEDYIRNSKNNYDYEGESILAVHKDIDNYVEQIITDSTATYENDLKPYIDGKIQTLKPIDVNNFNSDETALLDSFKLNFVPSVDYVIAYENFVFDNFPDQTKVSEFLITISRIKFQIFIHNADINHNHEEGEGRTLSAWENCVVACMRNEYEDYNVVDWVQFALNPGADVLWTAASCGWDCRRRGYYGE